VEGAFPLFFVLFALVAAGVAAYQYWAKQQRRQEFASFAAQHGLVYHQQDPFDLLAEPFKLFSKGDGRGIENVLDGTWEEIPIRAFDYWYYEESSSSNGGRSKTYYRFDCVIAPIDAACSALTIDRENLFTRLADHLAMDDIQFELDEFNRAFNVKGSDRRFATAFCDQRMMRWLLANGGNCGFEVMGDRLMAFCRKVDVEALPVLLATMRGFRQQIPAVVYSLYPR
jgi:hypothetical protein